MSERRQSIGEKIADGLHQAHDYVTGAIFNSRDDDTAAPNSNPGPEGDNDKYGVKQVSPEGHTGASNARAHQMAH